MCSNSAPNFKAIKQSTCNSFAKRRKIMMKIRLTLMAHTYCISGMTGEIQLKFGIGDIPPLHNEIC